MSDKMDNLDFAPPRALPLPYLHRIRTYYLALGYETPYRWAQYEDAPFQNLDKPLAECRVTLASTAALYDPTKGDQGPGAPYNNAAKFYKVYTGDSAGEPDVRISHVGIDRVHTTAEDMNSWFPLKQLKRLASEGRIGSIAPRFIGVPTNRSQKTTIEQDCAEILEIVRQDGSDVAVLVANCPVCHQSISLVARHLEANGIPTVVMGCAKDIVEHVGVPRLLFSDFPLGNAAGRPHDVASQATTIELALRLLETASGPRTTMQSPLRWSDSHDWKLDFSNVDLLSEEELERRRAEFRAGKEIAWKIKRDAGLRANVAAE
jgi:D-proline reductase (dithiol) PrdB